MRAGPAEGVPLPEAVDLGEWTIEEAPGDGREAFSILDAAAGRGGKLSVPLGGGARERYIRAHELGHAAWSPRGPFPPHLPETTMQHAEDARIARRLAAVGIRSQVRLLSDAEIDRTAAGLADGTLERADVASILLATLGGRDGDELARAVGRLDPDMPARVERIWADTIGRGERPEFRRAIEAAEMLLRLFGRPNPAPAGSSVSERAVGRTVRGAASAMEDDGDPGWGELQVVELPRPLRLAPRLRGEGWRAAPDGIRLGDPSRFHRDGRGWRARRRRRQAGGTALIDCSGSMSLTPEMLEDLVSANPAAVVATYSGDDDRQQGRLHIVARQGRRVRPEHVRPPGTYNICDGPALDWLGRQPAPRIWVSDGGVTGRGEVCSAALVADAETRARRYRIRRVETTDALIGEWHQAIR